MKDYTFFFFFDGQKILSKGKSIHCLVVTDDLTFHLDLKITSLLHDVDLILGINWLHAVNLLIYSRSSRVFLTPDAGTSVLSCNWLDQSHKASTVKVVHDAVALTALRDNHVQRQISVFWTPQFSSYVGSNAKWCHSLKGEKVLNTGKNMTEKEKNRKNESIGQN